VGASFSNGLADGLIVGPGGGVRPKDKQYLVIRLLSEHSFLPYYPVILHLSGRVAHSVHGYVIGIHGLRDGVDVTGHPVEDAKVLSVGVIQFVQHAQRAAIEHKRTLPTLAHLKLQNDSH
jgi:hypothetical protein